MANAFGLALSGLEKCMEENGNPPIEFQVSNCNVCCVLRKKQTAELKHRLLITVEED
jgi:hypothetical protein